MDKETRNADIRLCYAAGATLQECADRYRLSKQRIAQILREGGINLRRRTGPNAARTLPIGLTDGVVTTDARETLLGVNLTEADKEALRAEAARRGVSMSSLSAEWIKERLNDKDIA